MYLLLSKTNIFNSDRNNIGLKWIFTINDNGIFGSILVSKVFNQVETIDYKG